MNKKRIDQSLVKKLYLGNEHSQVEIASMVGCSPGNIQYLTKHGGYRRNLIDARHATYQRQKHGNNWRGGRHIDKKGYVYILDVETRDYIPEHHVVWEKAHNRKLTEGAIIHHLNGIKDDNRPCNLVAFSRRKHGVIIPTFQQKIRELEIENRFLEKVLESNQMIFHISAG